MKTESAMADEALSSLTLAEAAEAVAGKKVSSVELTRNCLERLENLHPKLNCLAGMDAEQALSDAEAADAELASGRLRGALHGVPLAHKDMFYRRGRISGCGSRIRAGFVPEVTSTALRRLDAAGALDIARLQMVEFAYGLTGHNEVHGNTRNPWNVEYIPGGSSSGPAAAVGGRLIYGALGSDTGGSIRFPASCCGLVGMKPTYGRVSRFGVMPLAASLDHVGPLTRGVADAALILREISGADPDDPTCAAKPVTDYTSNIRNSIKGIRLGVPASYFTEGLHDEVRVCMEHSLDVFKQAGAELVEVKMPESFSISNAMVNLITGAEGAAIHSNWLRERSEEYGSQTRERFMAGLLYPATDYLEALNLRKLVLEEFLQEVLGKADILHAPVSLLPVPTLAESDLKANPGFLEYINQLGHCTRPFDYLGLPALTVPAGHTANGLPTGFQLVGHPFDEGRLFQCASIYERESGWNYPELDGTASA